MKSASEAMVQLQVLQEIKIVEELKLKSNPPNAEYDKISKNLWHLLNSLEPVTVEIANPTMPTNGNT